MSDELANDRTYLAWLWTGIAHLALGFVVAKVALIVQPDTKGRGHSLWWVTSNMRACLTSLA